MSGDPFVHDDAAYVLGALSGDERRAFEAHLAGCARCRARVEEVRGVPQLLAGLSADDLAEEPVPDTLLPGLLRRAGVRRRRQRWLVGGLAAVAAACVLALVVLVWPSSGGGTPTAQSREFVPVVSTPVRANASLVAKAWGTQIEVHCSYAPGVNRPYPYALRVVDAAGHADTLGSWTVPVDHDIAYQAGTRYPLADIVKVQIVTLDGKPILQLDN